MSSNKNYKGLATFGIVGVLFLVGVIVAGSAIISNPNFKFDLRKLAGSSQNLHGQRFAFINHPRRDMTEDELQYVAKNYDLVVVGNQNKPMTAEASRLKILNPALKVYLYFPTSIRQNISTNYGGEVFKEEWLLHDKAGTRIPKTASLDFVDLTNSEYRVWAESTVLGFLNSAPYDGVLFDNANPIGVEGSGNWVTLIGQPKIDSWNQARINYLTRMHKILTAKGKKIVYNGINRHPSKINRTLDTLDFTDGAINERFCYEQGNSGSGAFISKELQLEDINLQLDIGKRNKLVLQKVNIEPSIKSRYGKFCYGVFLMGHVPGYTFFKYGEGYNLLSYPDEYKITPSEVNMPLGLPTENYKRQDWLLYRKFEKMWAVVNLGNAPANWINPDDGASFIIPAQDAVFLVRVPKTTKPSEAPSIAPSPSQNPTATTSPQNKTTTPVESCRNYCKDTFSISRTDAGWCAFAEKNCAISEARYSPGGNQFCPSDRNFCCCRE